MSSINGIEIGEIPTGRFVASSGWENFGTILLLVLGTGILLILAVGLFAKKKDEDLIVSNDNKLATASLGFGGSGPSKEETKTK